MVTTDVLKMLNLLNYPVNVTRDCYNDVVTLRRSDCADQSCTLQNEVNHGV